MAEFELRATKWKSISPHFWKSSGWHGRLGLCTAVQILALQRNKMCVTTPSAHRFIASDLKRGRVYRLDRGKMLA